MSPCPICNRPAAPRAQNRAHPFCSPRCKLVDLGKWLGEQYRVFGTDTPDASSDADADAEGLEDHA